MNILLVLKTSIMTRISGYGRIGRDNFIMIPIGGKSVFAAGETFSSQMANLISQMKNESKRNRSVSLLKQVYQRLEQLLGSSKFVWHNSEDKKTEEISYLAMGESFTKEFLQIGNNGLDGLLNFGALQLSYISGSLLVVPADENLEEIYEMLIQAQIRRVVNDDLLQKMQIISHSKTYPPSRQAAIKDAIELVKKLRNCDEKTQRYKQQSQQWVRYYALPLFTFTSGEIISDYFARDPEEPEGESFRNILEVYIRSLYPVGNILPIGHKYQDFPFVVFRSYSLEELRAKIFTDKYLLTSNELNVLNLILAKND